MLEAGSLQPVPGGAYHGPAPLSALWGAPWLGTSVVSQAALNQMTSLLLMVIVAWVLLMMAVGGVLLAMAAAARVGEKRELQQLQQEEEEERPQTSVGVVRKRARRE